MPWKDSLWRRWRVAVGVETPTGRHYVTLKRSTWDTERRYTRARLCFDALKHSRYGNSRHIVTQGWFFEDSQGQTERLALNSKQQIWKCSQSNCIGTGYRSVKAHYNVTLSFTALLCFANVLFKLSVSMINLCDHWLIKSLRRQVCALKIRSHPRFLICCSLNPSIVGVQVESHIYLWYW